MEKKHIDLAWDPVKKKLVTDFMQDGYSPEYCDGIVRIGAFDENDTPYELEIFSEN